MKRILYAVLLISFIAFTILGIQNIRVANHKIQLKEIQLKDTTVELQQLNSEYNKLLEQKQVDKQKLKELEEQKKKLETDLQAKIEKKEAEKIALQNRASLSQTVQATSNCAELASRLTNLGITGAELNAAITLATRESSCRSGAVNSSSGACGEFQSLPCGKWGSPGTDQYLLGAINYAKSRYGSFVNALGHSYSQGWY